MLSRSTSLAWIGIVVLSGMFLMGQQTWEQPQCVDNDGDGYGNPNSLACPHPHLDCDDTDPDVYPGATEICDNETDDDCDLLIDYTDTDCPCQDGDGDGYGDPVNEGCTYPGLDCDDGNASVNPGTVEGPLGDPTCSDGLDNDCDGNTDTLDYGCLPASEIVTIPAGCFDMGDAFSEGEADELPVHNVCISAFEMDVHEVTNGEYEECVNVGVCDAPSKLTSGPVGNERPSYFGEPAYNDFPVTYVGWDDAEAYCEWAGKRLPTEAEWEYAARGGLPEPPDTEYKRYPWGDDIDCDDANYGRYHPINPPPCLEYGGLDDDTHQVQSYAANGYGLHDMVGNVWEWVHDWYLVDYYGASPTQDPTGPATGVFRVQRGGSWASYDLLQEDYDVRVADRGWILPSTNTSFSSGFRCARTPVP